MEAGSYGDTFQIVSCEELGKVIIWTVLDSLRDSDVHLGLAHWGCVRIVNSVQMDLECVSTQDVIFGPRKSKTINTTASNGSAAASESGGDGGSGSGAGDLFVAMSNGEENRIHSISFYKKQYLYNIPRPSTSQTESAII